MASIVIGFDVYGTLIDTAGVAASLEKMVTGRGAAFAAAWRQKQLEYTFRRVAMRAYKGFDVCTRAALDHTDAAFGSKLTAAQKDALMDEYRRLPAFPDVLPALDAALGMRARALAFTNGLAADVHELLKNARIRERFEDIVSVDEVHSFKPDPAVYEHFVVRACVPAAQCWLVSANPFDVIGAIAAGMNAVWVQRTSAVVFDPWEIEPTATISDLSQLSKALQSA